MMKINYFKNDKTKKKPIKLTHKNPEAFAFLVSDPIPTKGGFTGEYNDEGTENTNNGSGNDASSDTLYDPDLNPVLEQASASDLEPLAKMLEQIDRRRCQHHFGTEHERDVVNISSRIRLVGSSIYALLCRQFPGTGILGDPLQPVKIPRRTYEEIVRIVVEYDCAAWDWVSGQSAENMELMLLIHMFTNEFPHSSMEKHHRFPREVREAFYINPDSRTSRSEFLWNKEPSEAYVAAIQAAIRANCFPEEEPLYIIPDTRYESKILHVPRIFLRCLRHVAILRQKQKMPSAS